MAFGQIIKKLRVESDRTQEQLAELLGISPQAVSRWETNAAMPDISLLPPLANLFGVTTDYLLGMDTYQKDLRRAEYDEAFQEYWKKVDKEKNYQIALKAATEYPGDIDYLNWLADNECYVAFLRKEDSEYRELLESSFQHGKTVYENATSEKLRGRALHTMVLDLHYLGRNEEAKKYAMLEEDERRRDEMLVWCLEGEELKRHSQKMLDSNLCELITYMPRGQNSLEAYEAIEAILKLMFPDGDYCFHHNTLQYNFTSKVYLLCGQQKYEEAIAALQKARHHAEEMMKFDRETYWHHTSPLFNLLEGEKPLPDAATTDVEGFIACLKNNHCFDPIRDREDFKALEAPFVL